MANTAVLIVALGILLYLGKSVLLPILAAVIVVYVLVNTSAALGRVPVIGRLLFLSAAGLLFYAAPAADIVGGLALAGLLAWRFLRGAPQPGRAG